MKNNIKNLVEGLLSENMQSVIGITPVMTMPGIVNQSEVRHDEEELDEKKDLETFCVTVNGKCVWEGPAKDSKEAISKAKDEEGVDEFEGNVKVQKNSELKESEEDVKLSPQEFRTLYNCYIAEQMINESMDNMTELEEAGLLTEGKMNEKGKKLLKMYLPTLFAS